MDSQEKGGKNQNSIPNLVLEKNSANSVDSTSDQRSCSRANFNTKLTWSKSGKT